MGDFVSKKDKEKAKLERAANAGSLDAMYTLGLLAYGEGDVAGARTWWEPVAAGGYPDAMYNLGNLAKGEGDVAGARDWWEQAAAGGYSDAMYNLGFLAKDEGDTAGARDWYEQAAAAGNSDAMYNLGNLAKGEGDVAGARDWYEQAAAEGDLNALASHSWSCLMTSNYQQAVTFGDLVMPAVIAFTEASRDDPDIGERVVSELANCQSNLALCRLALGGTFDEANAVWAQGAQCGHEESLFFPAVIALRQGNHLKARQIVAALSPETLDSMRATTSKVLAENEGEGWFVQWCQDAVSLLDPNSIKAPRRSIALELPGRQ